VCMYTCMYNYRHRFSDEFSVEIYLDTRAKKTCFQALSIFTICKKYCFWCEQYQTEFLHTIYFYTLFQI